MLITDVANEEDLNLNSSYTGVIPLNMQAGNYTVILYLDDVYIVAAQVFFEVRRLERSAMCPIRATPATASPPCSGRGSCAAGDAVQVLGPLLVVRLQQRLRRRRRSKC
jgi:RNase P/RNase MRP subunit p29